MITQRNLCFRHVVFPDEGFGRATNLAPPSVRAPAFVRAVADEAELCARQESFADWLFERAGLNASHYKPQTLARRVPACLRALKTQCPADARSLLRRHPALLPAAVSTVVIGVSEFFRDPAVFHTLGNTILPDLLDAARRRGGRLRIWSAGCSDGQELYSVAILLAEIGALGEAELIGTDCRPDALHRAQDGYYDAASLKSVPPTILQRWFTQNASSRFRIHADLRAAVRWRAADVLAHSEAGPFDLVLCRNLAIYLKPDAATLLWSNLISPLRRSGYLVVGHAEKVMLEGLSPVGTCLYRRRSVDCGRTLG